LEFVFVLTNTYPTSHHIYNTRPTRGGTFRYHQIALEHHRKAERLGFGFLLPKTNITIQTGTTPARGG